MAVRRNPETTDHDLLIRIDAKVEMLTASLQQMQVGFTVRVERLETEKAGYKDLDVLRRLLEEKALAKELVEVKLDAESISREVGSLRKYVWMAMGAIAAVEVALRFIFKML